MKYTETHNKESLKKKHIIKRRKRDNQIVTDYSQITVNENKVSIGDSVVIRDYYGGECYAIVNSIYTKGHHPAMVSVSWYYSPSDIFETVHSFLGTAELFTSNHE